MADPLSDTLSLLDARCELSTGLCAGERWGVRVGRYEGLKFNVVLQGSAWLVPEGAAAVPLAAGDCFVLGGGAPFVLASAPDVPSRDAAEVFADAPEGGSVRIGSGKDFSVAGGRMVLAPASAGLLVGALPALIHLPASSTAAQTARWLLSLFVRELQAGGPGSRTQATHAMHMIFVELMRMQLASPGGVPAGWLSALADERIGRVLEALHGEPLRRWTLPELAAIARLSRSGFALRFRKVVGRPPLDYVLTLRMHIAAYDLRQRRKPVAAISQALGYSSESAFGSAFKRVFGCAPRTYAPRRSDAPA